MGYVPPSIACAEVVSRISSLVDFTSGQGLLAGKQELVASRILATFLRAYSWSIYSRYYS
jgi:hypothetical protein